MLLICHYAHTTAIVSILVQHIPSQTAASVRALCVLTDVVTGVCILCTLVNIYTTQAIYRLARNHRGNESTSKLMK